MPKLDQIWTFLSSVVELHRKTGGALLPLDKVKERYLICTTSGPNGVSCEHFTGRGCKLCGCCTNSRKSLFNKLAYGPQACPDGRWKAVE